MNKEGPTSDCGIEQLGGTRIDACLNRRVCCIGFFVVGVICYAAFVAKHLKMFRKPRFFAGEKAVSLLWRHFPGHTNYMSRTPSNIITGLWQTQRINSINMGPHLFVPEPLTYRPNVIFIIRD